MPIYTHSSLKIERMHSKNLMPMQCTQDPVVERFVVDRTQSPRLFSHRALGMKSSFMCSLGSCHSFSGWNLFSNTWQSVTQCSHYIDCLHHGRPLHPALCSVPPLFLALFRPLLLDSCQTLASLPWGRRASPAPRRWVQRAATAGSRPRTLLYQSSQWCTESACVDSWNKKIDKEKTKERWWIFTAAEMTLIVTLCAHSDSFQPVQATSWQELKVTA